MIIMPVKEGENIERALKKFKRKYERTGVLKELRRRQYFTKPSVAKREAMQHAIYVEHMYRDDDCPNADTLLNKHLFLQEEVLFHSCCTGPGRITSPLRPKGRRSAGAPRPRSRGFPKPGGCRRAVPRSWPRRSPS